DVRDDLSAAAEARVERSILPVADEHERPRAACEEDLPVRLYRDRNRLAWEVGGDETIVAEAAIERAVRVVAREQGSLASVSGDQNLAVRLECDRLRVKCKPVGTRFHDEDPVATKRRVE